MMNRYCLTIIATTILAGCSSLAPDYQRPPLPIANNWPSNTATAASDEKNDVKANNTDFITDAKLQQVIALALANNRDLRVTALNIEKTQAQYQIERATLFPHINATAAGTSSLTPAPLSYTGNRMVSHIYSAGLGFSAYELDFFGRVSSLKDATLEQYLSTQEAHRSAKITLSAEVATAWLTLAANQQHLSLAEQTLKSQQATYAMDKRRFELGVISQLDFNLSQAALDSAHSDIAHYTSLVAQNQNALTLLVGTVLPAELLPSAPLNEFSAVRQLPLGLPSDLLQNRPDILGAEHQLKAANADIGAARAAFFPSITLTSSLGTGSRQLSGLFGSNSRTWQFVPQLNLPIFDGGTNSANLKVSQATHDIYLAQYEKSIQSAFREVADALADHDTLSKQLTAQQSVVDATALSAKLSDARFQNGIDSDLAVQDRQRTLYAAQHNLINLQLSQVDSLITLYKALGGGNVK